MDYYVATVQIDEEVAGRTEYIPPLTRDDHLRIGSAFFSDVNGREKPLSPDVRDRLPKTILWDWHNDKIADVIWRLDTMIISQPFKTILETLEPDRHEFIEVAVVRMRQPSLPPLPFYFCNLAWIEGALDVANTHLVAVDMPPLGKVLMHSSGGEGGGIGLFFEKLEGHHFWRSRDKHIYGRYIASETLVQEVQRRSLRAIKFSRCFPMGHKPED